MADNPFDFGGAAKSLSRDKSESEQEDSLDFSFAAGEIARGSAGASLKAVEGTDADQAARALDLSKRSGLPLPAVEGSEQEVESKLRSDSVAKQLDRSPSTRSFFIDPTNAKIAHDDAESLSALESVWRYGKNALHRGALRVEQGGRQFLAEQEAVRSADADRSFSDILSDESGQPFDYFIPSPIDLYNSGVRFLMSRMNEDAAANAQAQLQEVGRLSERIGEIALSPPATRARDSIMGAGQDGLMSAIEAAASDPSGTLALGLEVGAEFLPQISAASAATAATRNPTAGAAIMGFASGLTERFASPAEFLKKRGVDLTDPDQVQATLANPKLMQEAREYGFTRGSIIGSFDAVAGGLAGEAFGGPLLNMLSQLSIQATLGGGGEATAQLVTDGVIDWGEVVLEAVGELATAPVEVVGVGGTYFSEARAARRASAAKEILDVANDAAIATKLNQRSPEKFAELNGKVMRDQGIDRVSIPAQALNEYLQDAEDDPVSTIRAMGIADQMDEALAIGGDVDLTPEAFSEHILGTDAYVSLADHIRMEEEGLTVAEAAEWEQSGLQEEIDRVASEFEQFDAVEQSDVAQIQAEVEQQMSALGEPAQTAQYAAVLTAQRYATRAQRSGVSPLELWRDDNLQIVSDDAVSQEQFEARANEFIQDISTGPDGRTQRFDEDLAQWQRQAQRFIDGKKVDRQVRLGREFFVLSELAGAGRGLSIAPQVADRVRKDHPDVPESVWLNLPELLADPVYVMPHRQGGLNVVLDAQTEAGDPIVVGIRDGALRTITPRHTRGQDSGTDRMLGDVMSALERGDRVYVRDEKARDDLLRLPQERQGNASQVQLTKSGVGQLRRRGLGRNVLNRDDIVKGQGRLFYQLDQENRGSIRFDPDRIIMRLGENADRSTFLHESGHLYLEQLSSDAAAFGASSPQLVDDWNTVRDWWAGRSAEIKAEAIDYARRAKDTEAVAEISKMADSAVSSYAQLGQLDTDGVNGYLTRAMHEQWARGTEDYFRTGQAPSVALQEAFNRFRAWLVSIYSAMKRRLGKEQLEVQFSADVTAVMDRLLATDEEISLVEEQYNLKALFGSAEEIGMTPKQFEAYQRSVARATEDAKTRQLKKHLNQIEREKLKWWQEEAERVRDQEIAPEIHARPIYRAIFNLTRGVMPDGSDIPGGMRPSRLDRDAVVSLLGSKEALSRLPRVRGKAVYTTSKNEGGSHPDIAANLYGYEDGEAMLLEMMNAPDMTDAIVDAVDKAMKDRYGDMLNDGEAVSEAIEATHNDKRGDVLAAELNALRDSGEKMKSSFVRQWAKERIGTRKLEEIRPDKFLSAEKRAAKKAGRLLRSGDRLGAQRAKFEQLMNFYMAKESYRVRDEVAKQREYLSQFNNERKKWPSVDADYIEKIKTILEAYHLGSRLSERRKTILELRAIADWVERQKEDEGATLEIPSEILAANERTHYRDLTLDEWRTLHDTIKQIETQGRLKKTALIDGETREINEMSDEIARRLDDLPRSARQARKAVEQNPGAFDRIAGGLASFDASLRKVEFLIERLDGEKGGPAHQYIFQPLADAEAAKNDLTATVTKTIVDALDGLPRDVRSSLSRKVEVPLLGRTFRRSDLLMMALNVGNESNYEKMLDGSAKDVTEGSRPWTEEGVDEALSHLSAEEWDFVQTVWDAFESMYPQVQEIYRRENGIAPERVEARSIETRHGQTLRGGYFPMMYDPSRSAQARDIEGKSALEAMQSTIVKSSVYSGMTKARTAFSAPVLLDLEKLPGHIEKTAHFISHYEAIRTARRLISRRDIVEGITNSLGREYYDTIKAWIGDIAANGQPVDPTDTAGRIVEAMRTNATVAIMGLSYTTMASQLLGYANTLDALSRTPDGGFNPLKGSKWMAVGMAQYLRNPAEAKRKVFELSGEMRHRLQNTDRDIRRGLRDVSRSRIGGLKPTAWRDFQRFSLMGIAGAQLYMVDFPTWLGAYNRAVSEGATIEDAARAADNIIRTSQTAGGIKDLSSIQRKRGVTSALTMFYSYFNLLYNLQAQIAGNVQGPRDIPQAAARAFILMLVPTALEAILRQEWPEEDEDYGLWLSMKATFYGMASVPFLRDMTGIAEGFGYSVSPIDSFGKSLGRSFATVSKSIDDGELSETALKSLVAAFGFAIGAPATQVNRVVDAGAAMFEGKEVGPYDFLTGHKEEN